MGRGSEGTRSSRLRWHSYWITGASSGIGAALAYAIAGPGVTLFLSGRSEERLATTAARCETRGADTVVVPFDMADPAARHAAATQVLSAEPAPQVLINNAGLSQRGRVAETDISVDRTIMEVDYLAGVELTKAILPQMLAAGDGCIVAVSSVAGLAPIPVRSSYNAAKAAQLQFFGTLANEIAGSGVQVSLVIPGFVKTPVSVNAITGDGASSGVMDPNQAGAISAERAASAILRGISSGKRRIFTGYPPKLLLLRAMAKLAPGVLDRMLQKAKVR